MKAKVSAKKLNEKLKFIKEIYKMKGLDVMYKNMRIEFNKNLLYITAINPMCCVRTFIDDVSSDLPFSALVDAESFISIISRYSADLNFDFGTNKVLMIEHGSGKIKTNWYDISSFPMIYAPGGDSITYKCSDFIPFLKNAFVFTTNDEFRDSLSMAHIFINEKHISVISTDLFSIYVHREDNVNNIECLDFSINETAAGILYGFASKSNGDIRVSSGENNNITFLSFGDTVVYNVNPTHKIPKWEVVVNSYNPDIKMIVSSNIIMDSINKCMMDKIASTVYLGKDKSGIKSSDIEKGIDIVEYFMPELMEGENISFDIKLKKLRDTISCLSSKKIMIEVCSANKFLRVSNPENTNKEFILLSTYKN